MPESGNFIGQDQGLPRLFFDKQADQESVIKTILKDNETLSQGRGLHCVFCHTLITRQGNGIDQLGRHIHTFENPAGYEFTIGCFARAYCVQTGTPTSEWSWFPDYHWQYTLCHQCHEHLGWFYRSITSSSGFYGLIMARLVEVSEH